MGFVVYVRAGETTLSRTPADLAAAADGEGPSPPWEAETAVALRAEGPFRPLSRALREDGALRDAFAAAIRAPSLGGYAKLRIALAAVVALPLLALVELDRELFARSGPARIAVDLLLAAWVVFELSRRTPRMPRVAAACLLAIAFRWSLVATRLCGRHVHWLVWTAMGLSLAGAAIFVFRVPTRARIELELLDKLGISRDQQRAALAERAPPHAVVAAAVACAAGLPAMLHLMRAWGASLELQTLAFVSFAAAAPILARRFGEQGPEPARTIPPARVLLGIAVGLALTAAAVSCARQFFDVGAELAHCVHRLDREARLARLAESQELSRAVARIRASAPLILMTSIVFPYAEERVYRGLLQEVLARKLGGTYGILAASVAFGIAHLGVYEVALYQTVLLGLGFGFAYAEGGLLAAFVVHATWNVMQMG